MTSAKFRVALSLRIVQANGYVEPRDAISHDWIRLLDSWDMMPCLIPNCLDDPIGFLTAQSVDLLVLTGGDDIGATPERDDTETAMLAFAAATGLPTLGVCRGMQLINVVHGGGTRPVEDWTQTSHVASHHPVRFSADWEAYYGYCADVNSYHDQGIAEADVGTGLLITGRDSDDLVEALAVLGKPIAGVMWHPEREGAPAGDQRLIQSLIKMPRDD